MRAFARLYAWPALIALLSLVGLVAALIGDGPLDWLSWLGLAAPVCALGWALTRRLSEDA